MNLRFRVAQTLPFDRRRRADISFTSVGLHVFIDGCFWHGCREHFVMPKTNTAFWEQKIAANQARDWDTIKRLDECGLTAMRFWEHEDVDDVAETIAATYRRLKSGRDRDNRGLL